MMKLITNTSQCVKKLGLDETIGMMARAGFDALDWSFFDMWQETSIWRQENWRELAAHVREQCAACGISVVQAHAPFPTSGDTKEFDDHAMSLILQAMEAASIMGATQIVVHPRQQLPHARFSEQLFEENVALYKGLIPYCEKWNIRVCAENMWQYDKRRGYIVDSVCSRPEEFNALLDAVDSRWIIGCLDLGHCALVGQEPAEIIRKMGASHIKALHVHDVDWKHDNHDMPFLQKQDWEAICRALGEIGYEGDFTFECDTFQDRFPAPLCEAATAMLAQVGRYLISRVEAYRG